MDVLKTLGIPFDIMPEAVAEVNKCVERAIKNMAESCSPYALVVRKGTFEPYQKEEDKGEHYLLLREAVIETFLKII